MPAHLLVTPSCPARHRSGRTRGARSISRPPPASAGIVPQLDEKETRLNGNKTKHDPKEHDKDSPPPVAHRESGTCLQGKAKTSSEYLLQRKRWTGEGMI